MRTILFRLLISMVNADLIKSVVVSALGFLEAAIISSSTDWDDKTLLPVLKKLKDAMSVK